jgi:hypothetical protein
MPKNSGLYIQLVNRNNSRIIFSACTGDMSREAFDVLWAAVGSAIYDGVKPDPARQNYYELRIDPILGGAA